ncbi:cobalt ECF transporter T component CbiQ [Amphibacillus cookii]|uniref:cobalt ECF transporter T component CbiQ n=1 Tax=Amphibacillus cookii TaxID=767787 RepID=UPI00195E7A65|nr:cobalt ECF transporter T component CbiQ [Amphibacillus cookii]MBM7542373.1 cobalt/nickel transport system permease protein [Amphibacillus cookii]
MLIKANKRSSVPDWATRWESRSKLIAAISYTFTAISLTHIVSIFIAYLLALTTLFLMNIPIKLLLQRYLIISPFLLLMTVPLFWSFQHQQSIFALILLLKAFTSMTVLTIILETQTLDQLMSGLLGFHIPPTLITILVLSYRYVFLLLDDVQRMLTAIKSRLFHGGIRFKSLKIYGQLMAALLVKAFERSEHMYEAMTARGFTGSLPITSTAIITKQDGLKTVISILIIAALIIIDKRVNL